jgi:oligo-1,6-glucosidase/alpha-glucosidase
LNNTSNSTTDFWKTTTVYQIYPRSFFDSNGDGIGDLEGIIQKLDYIQSIGFETIWISPFFSSPQADFGYDIADYRNIAPEYGSLAIVERLIDEMHKRNMYVVFDMVMNHTSDQHPWFKASKSSNNNSKSDWYIWKKGKGKNPPNNWKSMTGGGGWHYVKERDEWYFATFLPFQPDLNYHNPEVKKEMFDTIRFWLAKGVDGFRLDIFNVIIKDPTFRNNPWSYKLIPNEENPDGFFQQNKYTVNYPQNFSFAKELRSVLNEFSNKFLVGEVFGNLKTIREYIGNQDGLHAVFIFEMLKFKWNPKYFKELISKIEGQFQSPAIPVYVFSNHDKKRSESRLKGNLEKSKLLHFLQFTLRGIPFMYYGEEIGMQNLNIPLKNGLDPIAKKYKILPQFIVNRISDTINRDEVRTPMQWNTNINAGFTTHNKTWLPINPNYKKINVETQIGDKNSLLNTIKAILSFRKNSLTLQSGAFNWFNNPNMPDEVLAFERTDEKEQLLILMNFSERSLNIKTLNDYSIVFGEKVVEQIIGNSKTFVFGGLGFGIFKIK